MNKVFFPLMALFFMNTTAVADIYTVKKIINGNTILLNDNQTVRLIGVVVPSVNNENANKAGARIFGMDPDVVNLYGDRATKFLHEMTRGFKIRIEYDPIHEEIGHKDKNGSTLAYVYAITNLSVNSSISLADLLVYWKGIVEVYGERRREIFLNATVVKTGHGIAWRGVPFKYNKKFFGYEKNARKDKRGLWAENTELTLALKGWSPYKD